MENRYGKQARDWERSRGGGYGLREGSSSSQSRGYPPRQEYGSEGNALWGYPERERSDYPEEEYRGGERWGRWGNEPYWGSHEDWERRGWEHGGWQGGAWHGGERGRWPERSGWGSERGGWQGRERDEGNTWERMKESVKRTFAGKGPKGFVRTDARVHEDVCELLMEHPEVDASDIEVTVNNGEVTLAGTVVERRQKRLAEDMAEEVMGVRFVENRLRVREWEEERKATAAGTTTTTSGATTGATAGTTGQTWKDTH